MKGVAELNHTAWFDYRFAHPVTRVFAFAAVYADRYQRVARLLGRPWLRPAWVSGNPLAKMTDRQLTCLVTATFTADALGIPYDFYLDRVMEHHVRVPTGMSETEKKRLPAPPLPNQLYVKSALPKISDAWAQRNVDGIFTARNAVYKASDFEGHPFQREYVEYLFECVSNKSNRAFYLSRLIYDLGHLREDWVEDRFGTSTLERCRDYK